MAACLGQGWLLLQACPRQADLQVGQLALLLLGDLALPLEVLLPNALSLPLPESGGQSSETSCQQL